MFESDKFLRIFLLARNANEATFLQLFAVVSYILVSDTLLGFVAPLSILSASAFIKQFAYVGVGHSKQLTLVGGVVAEYLVEWEEHGVFLGLVELLEHI